MTVEEAKRKLLAWAAEQLGTHEGADNRNKYAAMPEMTLLLGWNAQDQPWCNIFVNACFIACFGLETGAAMLYQPVGGGSALCRQSAAFFREHGAFGKSPEPGNVIFFYVGGEINHMGIVSRVVGGSVVTIEGNSGDTVAERCYSMTDKRIAGYGRPRWELAADTPSVTGASAGDSSLKEGAKKDHFADAGKTSEDRYGGIPISGLIVELPTLRCGMKGPWVAAMQGVLTWQRYNLGPDGVDGIFGPVTLGTVRNFQLRNHLDNDGIVGPLTWEALLGTQTT